MGGDDDDQATASAAATPSNAGDTAVPREQPAAMLEQPAATLEQPATALEQPAATLEQPAATLEKPSAAAAELADVTTPATAKNGPVPAADSGEPSMEESARPQRPSSASATAVADATATSAALLPSGSAVHDGDNAPAAPPEQGTSSEAGNLAAVQAERDKWKQACENLFEEYRDSARRFARMEAKFETLLGNGPVSRRKVVQPMSARRRRSSLGRSKGKGDSKTTPAHVKPRRSTVSNPTNIRKLQAMLGEGGEPGTNRDADLAVQEETAKSISKRRGSIHGMLLDRSALQEKLVITKPEDLQRLVGEGADRPVVARKSSMLRSKIGQIGRLKIESGYRMILGEGPDSSGSEADGDEPGQGPTRAEGSAADRRRRMLKMQNVVIAATHRTLDVGAKGGGGNKVAVDEGNAIQEGNEEEDDDTESVLGQPCHPDGPSAAKVHPKKSGPVKPAHTRKHKHSLRTLFRHVPVMHPESDFRARWNLCVLFMLMWYSFTIPLSIAFDFAPFSWWLAAEILFDVLFAIDIGLNFVTGYYSTQQGVRLIVLNRRMIVTNYLTSWFVIDLLSIVPFDVIVLALRFEGNSLARVSKLLRMLKLFKLLRLAGLMRYLKYWSERLKPGMLRLFSSFVIGLLTVHFLACAFYWISDSDPTIINTWSNAYGVRSSEVVFHKYLVSLYWSITTMTTVGYGDIVPQNNGEVAFVIIAMLISCSMFAYYVGNMAHIIASVDSTQTHFKERMEFVREYMSHQDLPIELQTRIKAYYAHCWKNLKSFPFSEDAILEDLSPALRREVVLFLNREMVETVPFFKGQDENFICNLILAMSSEICAPLDFVIRQGEVGKCMFFLRRGLVEVCNADATEVYTTLSDGSYFGEVSLLVGGRRTASVRAIFHCSLLRLEQEDLDDVLIDYPDAMRQIIKLAANSKYQLTDDERMSLQNRFEIFNQNSVDVSSGEGNSDLDDDIIQQEEEQRKANAKRAKEAKRAKQKKQKKQKRRQAKKGGDSTSKKPGEEKSGNSDSGEDSGEDSDEDGDQAGESMTMGGTTLRRTPLGSALLQEGPISPGSRTSTSPTGRTTGRPLRRSRTTKMAF